jgi:hypothetical protein
MAVSARVFGQKIMGSAYRLQLRHGFSPWMRIGFRNPSAIGFSGVGQGGG